MFHALLISDCTENNGVFANARPYGVYKIASTLRNKGYLVKTINHFSSLSDADLDRIIELYVSDTTFLIGVSATVLADKTKGFFFGISRERLISFFDRIRNKNKNVKFVAGGGQINNCSDDMKRSFSMFDYLSIGQGEEIIIKLTDHLVNQSPLKTVSITKPIILTDSVYPFEHISDSGITFHEDDDILPGECLPLEIARGCIFKCKFCNYDLTNKKLNEFTRNEERIREELLHNYEKFKTQHYYVVDDLLNDSVEKLEMLLRITESLPFKLYLGSYIRLDMLWRHPEMIDMLKKIGLVAAFLGIETINDKSGSIVGKGLGIKRINETLAKVNDCWKNEVFVEAGIILGLPNDTATTVEELENWSIDMLAKRHLHCLHFKPLEINPWLDKSEISKNPKKYGYTLDEFVPDSFDSFPDINWTTEHYSKIQAKTDVSRMYRNLNDKQWHILTTFNIPNILSLLEETEHEIYYSYLRDPQVSTKEQISYLTRTKDKMRKEQYLTKMLRYLA